MQYAAAIPLGQQTWRSYRVAAELRQCYRHGFTQMIAQMRCGGEGGAACWSAALNRSSPNSRRLTKRHQRDIVCRPLCYAAAAWLSKHWFKTRRLHAVGSRWENEVSLKFEGSPKTLATVQPSLRHSALPAHCRSGRVQQGTDDIIAPAGQDRLHVQRTHHKSNLGAAGR